MARKDDYISTMRPQDILKPVAAGLQQARCLSHRPGAAGGARADYARHKSGVAMRFPRISRLRWDKPPRDADRLETLERMLISDSTKPSPEAVDSH